MDICTACGMPVQSGDHYHPHAACLMFRACHNSADVEANLRGVGVYHRLAALREVREMVKHDLDCNVDDPCQHMARHLLRLNAMIKREEGR